MTETWRAVLGWEGWYEVSDLGRCRTIQKGDRAGFRQRETYPLVLTPLLYRKGYLKIQLGTCNKTRKRQRKYLHRLVYEAFNGPIPDDLTINHKDGVKANNRLSNLELATHTEQHAHARSLGLVAHSTSNGKRTAHLTADDVREIRRLRNSENRTYEEIAARFETAPTNIAAITLGKTWKHIT